MRLYQLQGDSMLPHCIRVKRAQNQVHPMKIHLLARLAVLTALIPIAPQAFGFGAGADNFANATVIDTDGTQTSSATNLTAYTAETGNGEPGHRTSGGIAAGRSAWWSYTAPESGYLTLDTITGGGMSDAIRDTVMGVYTGDAINSLIVVARNDDYTNPYSPEQTNLSRLTFYAQAGTTYRIAVDGYASNNITGTTYNVKLTLRLIPLRKLTRNAYINITNTISLSGGLTYTTTGTGAFSGKLTLGGKATPIAGVFGVDGLVTISIVRPVAKGATPLPPMTLILDGSLGGNGRLFVPEVSPSAFVILEQSVFKLPTDNPVPGYYTGGFGLGGMSVGLSPPRSKVTVLSRAASPFQMASPSLLPVF